jgi:hypothetical protein
MQRVLRLYRYAPVTHRWPNTECTDPYCRLAVANNAIVMGRDGI